MKETKHKIVKGFAAGIVAGLIVFVLMGAMGQNNLSEPIRVINDPDLAQVALAQNGRYQVSACALGTGGKGNSGYGVFVVDTSTGTTKAAYVSFLDKNGKMISVNQLGLPFSRIRSNAKSKGKK
jgi:thiamine transporter ThiT